MPCKQWNDSWVAQLYDELEPAEKRALVAHLDGCEECRRTLDELAASRRLLREAAQEIPASPRVVVLRPRPIWSNVWAFAAGAACALTLFAAGFVAGPRWTAQPRPLAAEVDRSPSTDSEEFELVRQLRDDLFSLRQRMDRLEQQEPSPDEAAQARFLEELNALEQRVNRERESDLEYVMRTLTAAEVRTGTWMDQTQDALTLLALRQDPRFNEQ